jgi:hypothetical protein
MSEIELTALEKELFEALKKPKYTFKDMENFFIERGINPFAPWMKEDHKRVQQILDNKEPPCDQ